MRTAALIELANIAGTPPPEIDCGRAPSSIPGNAAPVYQETSFPILDLYTDLFRLTDCYTDCEGLSREQMCSRLR